VTLRGSASPNACCRRRSLVLAKSTASRDLSPHLARTEDSGDPRAARSARSGQEGRGPPCAPRPGRSREPALGSRQGRGPGGGASRRARRGAGRRAAHVRRAGNPGAGAGHPEARGLAAPGRAGRGQRGPHREARAARPRSAAVTGGRLRRGFSHAERRSPRRRLSHPEPSGAEVGDDSAAREEPILRHSVSVPGGSRTSVGRTGNFPSKVILRAGRRSRAAHVLPIGGGGRGAPGAGLQKPGWTGTSELVALPGWVGGPRARPRLRLALRMS
jgi:hypothetical protein